MQYVCELSFNVTGHMQCDYDAAFNCQLAKIDWHYVIEMDSFVMN